MVVLCLEIPDEACVRKVAQRFSAHAIATRASKGSFFVVQLFDKLNVEDDNVGESVDDTGGAVSAVRNSRALQRTNYFFPFSSEDHERARDVGEIEGSAVWV